MKKLFLLVPSLYGLCLLSACSGAGGSSSPPPAASRFSVAAQATATAGTAFSFTVTALDSSNNVLASYSGTVHFSSSDSQAMLPASSALTNGTGNFSATLKTTGSQTITATDTVMASIAGTSSSINVTGGAASHFSVAVPGAATTGTPFNFTGTALDASNNVVTSYSGTVHFTSSDPQSVLPPNSTLTNGTAQFQATLGTVGGQSITATDTVAATITGTSSAINVNANYYVSPSGFDANDGSAAQPWATIQHAATQVRPGNTVHVLPGSYSGPIVSTVSGTVAQRIRFISDTKWGARITFSSSGAISGFANFGDYVDIQGFDVSGSGGDGTVGIDQEGSFSSVIGCHVHNITLLAASNGGAGIDDSNYSAHDDDIIGNVVHDIVGTTRPNSVQGIYHSIRGGHIWNNISYNNSGWGIHLWHAATGSSGSPLVISNNLVFSNREGGIVIGAGDSPIPGGMALDYVTVNNNIVLNNAIGIAEETDGISRIGTHNRYLNNLIYSCPNAISLYGSSHNQGTLNVDPRFVNYRPDGSGDYHLAPDSPCIGRGVAEGAPPYDLDGVARPQGANVDIGPYQWRPSARNSETGH